MASPSLSDAGAKATRLGHKLSEWRQTGSRMRVAQCQHSVCGMAVEVGPTAVSGPAARLPCKALSSEKLEERIAERIQEATAKAATNGHLVASSYTDQLGTWRGRCACGMAAVVADDGRILGSATTERCRAGTKPPPDVPVIGKSDADIERELKVSGATNASVREKLGVKLGRVTAIAARMEAAGLRPPCPCGKPASHLGMCKARWPKGRRVGVTTGYSPSHMTLAEIEKELTLLKGRTAVLEAAVEVLREAQ